MTRTFVVIAAIAWAGPAAAQSPMQLSFEAAIGAAEGAAESMTVARAEVDRSEANVRTARSGYLPQINGTSAYQRTLATEFDDIEFGPMDPSMGGGLEDLPFGQRNNWRLGLNVSQPLFDGFRTRAAVRQARAGARSAELGVRSTRAQVVLQAGQAYFDAVVTQREVEIAERALHEAQKTFDDTALGFKNGTTPEFDVLRAEVARDNQRTLLVQFQVQRDVALVQLRRLIGVKVDQPLVLTTSLDTDDVASVAAAARSAAGITGEASRVAIAQAKEGVEASAAGVEIARAQLFPLIAAGTDFGLVSYETHPFQSDWRTNWTLGVTLSVPIFDGFRRRSQVEASRAQLQGARAQLAFTAEVSQVEAAQAAAAVAASATQLETTTRTVLQARRAYQIAELRFQQGASTHLELIDARQQLEQALIGQARSARNLRVARLRQELLPGLPLGSATTGF
jgi:outer membrane protein TolC